MTEDPTDSPQKSTQSDKETLENKKTVSLGLLVLAWFIPFLWPFAIAGTIGMFPQTSKRIGYGVLGLIGFGIVAATINSLPQAAEKNSDSPSIPAEVSTSIAPLSPSTNKQENKSSVTTGDTSSGRIYLGTSNTGYELWADKDCIYVKGITEGDLARLGTDVWGFKKAVKAETGYRCVFYE